jgi:ribulose-5-phosphate 4-epimerase/fuculose-1-phosphate aldolase
MKDSFINLEVQKQVANMQVKYETAEKEKQILQQQQLVKPKTY